MEYSSQIKMIRMAFKWYGTCSMFHGLGLFKFMNQKDLYLCFIFFIVCLFRSKFFAAIFIYYFNEDFFIKTPEVIAKN